jgi:hypothetical protein
VCNQDVERYATASLVRKMEEQIITSSSRREHPHVPPLKPLGFPTFQVGQGFNPLSIAAESRTLIGDAVRRVFHRPANN